MNSIERRSEQPAEMPADTAQSQPSTLILLVWALWMPALLAVACVLFVLALIFDRDSLAALPL
ncbi:hypothetical protein [Rhodococcus pyridinivorans]